MLGLFLIFALTDYPAFDAKRAGQLCESTMLDRHGNLNYDGKKESCIDEQRAEYRHFMIIATHGEPTMAPTFLRCIRQWTRGGTVDWSMAQFCAEENVDGKRDFAMLRKIAPAAVRPIIDECLTDATEDDAPDWDDSADCARYQIGGHRDFLLFRAAALTSAEREKIDACRVEAVSEDTKAVRWTSAVDCAARGWPQPETATTP